MKSVSIEDASLALISVYNERIMRNGNTNIEGSWRQPSGDRFEDVRSIPQAIGRYQVLRKLGAGSFGVVYECFDPELSRSVAVKVLLAGSHADPELRSRFQREAQAVARLMHPSIAAIFDIGLHDVLPFIVMEYVAGCSLNEVMQAGQPWSVEQTVTLGWQLAAALAAAHAASIVHRDVKPSNIRIDEAGCPRLLDFGLAHLTDESHWLSRTGDILGTPRYMSPEQVLQPNSEIDYRTDIYSLGAILYELLAGVPAVDAPTPLATLRRLTDESIVPLSQLRVDLSANLCQLIMSMLDRNREMRPDSMQQVVAALKVISGVTNREAFVKIEPVGSVVTTNNQTSVRKKVGNFWYPGRTLITGVLLGILATMGASVFLNRAFQSDSTKAESPEETLVSRLDPLSQNLMKLATIRSPENYRDQLSLLLGQAEELIIEFPEDVRVRELQAKLLRRNGEYSRAARALAGLKPDELTHFAKLESLLALASSEIMIVHSLPETWMRYPASNELIAAVRAAEESSNFMRRAIASWIRLHLEDSSWNEQQVRELVGTIPETRNADRVDSLYQPDLIFWQAYTLSRWAHEIHGRISGATTEAAHTLRQQRSFVDQQAAELIQQGLSLDAHHVDMLYLRALRPGRTVEWETADGSQWVDVNRRQLAVFESAYRQFRNSIASNNPEHTLARAILLTHFAEEVRAMEQLDEFVGFREFPVVASTLLAWLRIRNDRDGEFSAADAGAMGQWLETEAQKAPRQFGLYCMLAVCRAMTGKWQDARQDLIRGRVASGADDWGLIAGDLESWCRASEEPMLEFQERTIDILWAYPWTNAALVELQRELLRSLQKGEGGFASELSEARVNSMRAWGHFRLAKMAAIEKERPEMLTEIKLALEQRDAAIAPALFQSDASFQPWIQDEEFLQLLSVYGEGIEKPDVN